MESLNSLPRSERMKIIEEEAEKRSKEYEDMRKQFETCKKCWMVTYTGNGWYCPLPYCGRR